jgi:O-antigen/teichoic acid export membrane protein
MAQNKSIFQQLAGQTFLYGLSSIVGRALNFLLTPFYTIWLGTAGFGQMTQLYAAVAFANIVYTFGLETAYFRFASKHKQASDEWYNHCMSFVILISTALSVIVFWFSDTIAIALDYAGAGLIIRWIAITLLIDAVTAIAFARLRLENKALRFALIRLANIFIFIGCNIFFFVLCPKWAATSENSEVVRWMAWYTPNLNEGYVFLSNLIASGSLLIFLFKEINIFRFTWSNIAQIQLFRYASPLVLMGLTGAVNEMLGRLIFKMVLPENFYAGMTAEEALGVFGGNYKFAMLMTLTIQAFRYAAEPFFFSRAADKNSPQLFADVMKWFIIFCCILMAAIGMNLDWLQMILLPNQDFQQGVEIVPILLLAQLLLGIYYNLSIWYKISEQTYFGTYISWLGAFITITLNFLLIPIWGYMGSVIATFVCYFAMTSISYYLGQKNYPIPYVVKNAITHIALATVFCTAGFIPLIDWQTGLIKYVVIPTLYLFIVFQLEKKHLQQLPFFQRKK